MKCALALALVAVAVDATQVSVCRDATYDITGAICAGNGNQGSACPRKGDKAVAACHEYLPSYDPATKSCIAKEDAVCVQVGPSVYGCAYPSLPCSPAPSTCNETLAVCPSWDYSESSSPSEIEFNAASAPAAWFTTTGSLPEYQVGCLDGSAVKPLTAPTPAPTQPNPTPAATTPAPTPANTTPSPTPASSTPKPTPASTTPAPTPAKTTPSTTTTAPTTAASTTSAPTTAAPTTAPTTPTPTPASTQPATATPTTQAKAVKVGRLQSTMVESPSSTPCTIMSFPSSYESSDSRGFYLSSTPTSSSEFYSPRSDSRFSGFTEQLEEDEDWVPRDAEVWNDHICGMELGENVQLPTIADVSAPIPPPTIMISPSMVYSPTRFDSPVSEVSPRLQPRYQNRKPAPKGILKTSSSKWEEKHVQFSITTTFIFPRKIGASVVPNSPHGPPFGMSMHHVNEIVEKVPKKTRRHRSPRRYEPLERIDVLLDAGINPHEMDECLDEILEIHTKRLQSQFDSVHERQRTFFDRYILVSAHSHKYVTKQPWYKKLSKKIKHIFRWQH